MRLAGFWQYIFNQCVLGYGIVIGYDDGIRPRKHV